MKDLYSEYKNHSYDSRRKLEPQFKKIGKILNRHFTKEDTWMANKCKNRCSMLLAPGKWDVKPWDIAIHLLEWLKLKILKMPGVNKDGEKVIH